MTSLLQRINLEKLGIYIFLAFLVLTPLLAKVRLGERIFVEPLAPLVAMSATAIVFAARRQGTSWKESLRRVFFPNRISVFYLLLMAVLLASFIYGVFLGGSFSLGDLLRIFKYALYFLSFPLAIYAGRMLGRTKVNYILIFLVLGGIITAAISLVRIFSFIFSGGEIDFWVYSIYNRSVGMLGQFFDPLDLESGLTGKAAHGTYGLYSTVILAVCLLLVSRFKEFSARWFTFFTMATFIFYAAILYTLSRGAIVTAGLVFGGWFLWLLTKKKIRVIVFTIAFLVVSSIILVGANPQVYQKFASTIKFLPQPDVVSDDGGQWGDEWDVALDASSRGRVDRWEKITTVLKENPAFLVFGIGYSRENLVEFTGVSSTHSLFLDLWARGGILALLLVAGIWVLIFRTIFRFLFSRDSEVQTFGYLLGAFATGWLLDNLISGEQFFSDAPMIAFWGVLGLVQALATSGRGQGTRKKVLIALTSTDVGGAPQVVHDLLTQVSKSKSESKRFEFVVAGPAGKFLQEFKKLGYKTYSVRLNKLSFGAFRKLLKIARKEEVDLINSHGKGAGLYARKAGFILDIPAVQTFHGLHYRYRNPLVRFLYLALERFLTLLTSRVINVSRSQEREGLKLGIFPKKKSRVVANGVTPIKTVTTIKSVKEFRRRLGIGERDFAVAMVARFDAVKGHERFIQLVPALVKAVPNLKIIFAGGGQGEKTAKMLVKELMVDGSVVFLGERNDVPRILAASDAFVLPSYHEGLPVSVLEASAAGLPIIGSAVVGIQDCVVNGQTGFLVDFDRPAEVVAAFKKLAKSPALRRRLGENGREFVEERFSMEKFVDKTLSVYKEALADNKS